MNDVMDPEKGLKTAVAETHDPESQPPGSFDGEQPSLLPLRNAEEGEEAKKRGLSAERGRGRPPGSKNKTTKAWTNYILSRYSSPLIFLAEVYNRPLSDLVRELQAVYMEINGLKNAPPMSMDDIMDILKLQLGAAKESAPYLHQKQPMAIQGDGAGMVNLFIGGAQVGSVSTDEAQNLDLEIIDVKSEENQSLDDQENENSNDLNSNGSVQDVEIIEENQDREAD